ncbi:S8 family serine peptidase [Aurantiacibacter gilvus]|uniref:S8 family serine peptidase n=1 Tax=Aurantiacibacter gilvus TaxID=3139141 RepID=A0ABU9IGR7_9SPHN
MHLVKLGLAASAAVAVLTTPAYGQNNLRMAPEGSEFVSGQFICVFSDRYPVLPNGVGTEARFVARDANGQVGHVYSNTIRGFVVRASEQGVRRMLSQNPNLAYCEQDQVMRVDPLAPPPGRGPNKDDGGGGDSGTSSQTIPWGVARVGGAGDGTGLTAWVIDSGIDLDHPDLNVDVGRSVDFTRSRSGAEDESGHGTHVAGTIAAIDNDFGVVGVAAGASVVAVRVLDRRGSGSYSDVIAGVDHVATFGDNGDVANMSLGGPYSQALNDAVIAAAATGVQFTLAAGNSGADANNYSPASANGTNIYTVSAFQQGDSWIYFSNYGNPPVDLTEPGVSIESTYKNGDYNTLSGTSMAAPHLAGILLLGSVRTDGTVSGDPDGNADLIGVR